MAFRCSMKRAIPSRRDHSCGWAASAGLFGLAALLLIGLRLPPCAAADLDAARVRQILAAATPGRPADFSGKSLEELDLSGLDFRGAKLAHANLFAAKLVGANFTGADLSGAKLDLAWIMRADFSHANLSGASCLGLVVASGLDYSAAEAPTFRGANFSGAHVIARLARFDLRGADFHGANMAPDLRNQSMGLMRADLSGADLAGANFEKADLGSALLRFANLKGANLIGANLSEADLAGADLTGADLTGANAAGADFKDAILRDVRGLDTVKGGPPPPKP
jgi:uncharacterized protein YjbI with pentapeptide repeats